MTRAEIVERQPDAEVAGRGSRVAGRRERQQRVRSAVDQHRFRELQLQLQLQLQPQPVRCQAGFVERRRDLAKQHPLLQLPRRDIDRDGAASAFPVGRRAAGLGQHPAAKAPEQAGPIGQRDEIPRHREPATARRPADQISASAP
jgi:hypothetical protein